MASSFAPGLHSKLVSLLCSALISHGQKQEEWASQSENWLAGSAVASSPLVAHRWNCPG